MAASDNGAGPAVDTRIAADIEDLRRRCTDTRELYREVCALLFFRYGITPTANRLYQYVRKGSMSTPAQVLAGFWRDLRERTRVRIEQPGLPEELQSLAGDLVLQLWDRAQRAAEHTLATRTADADEQVSKVREEQQAAQARAGLLEQEVERVRAALALAEAERERARAEAGGLVREMATLRGRLASMTEMLVDQGDEMRTLRNELTEAQRDVARAVGEANALRAQLGLERQRRQRRPAGGAAPDADHGQEALQLLPGLPEPPAASAGRAADPGLEDPATGAPGMLDALPAPKEPPGP